MTSRVHDTLLLFGATGDLSLRYLFPSLVHLLRDRLLPAEFRVVAIGRQDYDEAGFRAWLRERLGERGHAQSAPPSRTCWPAPTTWPWTWAMARRWRPRWPASPTAPA